jgi:hypothetical protein
MTRFSLSDKPDEPSELPLTITWAARPRDDGPPQRPEPPRQIEYRKPELPADLSEQAWSHVVAVTELIKKIAPSDVEPEEVFSLIEGWLRGHFVGKSAG